MRISHRKKWLIAGCSIALLAGIAVYAFWPTNLSKSHTTTIQITYDDRDYQIVQILPDDKLEAVTLLFDGHVGIETIQHPDRVDAYRIGQRPPSATKENAVEEFPILTGPVPVPDSLIPVVTAALLAPDSYLWGYGKNCEPHPGVCLAFYRQGDRIEVFLCFECSTLLVAHQSVVSGFGNFDFAQPTFARAVKSLFPSDEVIQRIEERDPVALKKLLGEAEHATHATQ